MAFTEEHAYTLDSLGLVIGKRVFPVRKVQALLEATQRQVGDRLKTPLLGFGKEFLAIMEHPWILDAVSFLVGTGVRLDHAFALQFPGQVSTTGGAAEAPVNLHGGPDCCGGSCYYHRGNDPTRPVWAGRVSVGVCLSHQNATTGGFCFIPGSHKSSFAWSGSRVHKRVLQGKINAACVQVPSLSPGDVVVFPDCLVHGTSGWQGEGKRYVLYYMYSPGFMAWEAYDKAIAPYVAEARSEQQKLLLRPPFAASWENDILAWRTQTVPSKVPLHVEKTSDSRHT